MKKKTRLHKQKKTPNFTLSIIKSIDRDIHIDHMLRYNNKWPISSIYESMGTFFHIK